MKNDISTSLLDGTLLQQEKIGLLSLNSTSNEEDMDDIDLELREIMNVNSPIRITTRLAHFRFLILGLFRFRTM